jgi:hypothetical protein
MVVNSIRCVKLPVMEVSLMRSFFLKNEND